MRLKSAIHYAFFPFNNLSDFEGASVIFDPDKLTEDDILLIWGGADIHPSLYKHAINPYTGVGNTPSERDLIEWALIQRAKDLSIPIIGVCRGAQMLCAAAGGTLYQHVTRHGGMHSVRTDNGLITVNSYHHQMMNVNNTNHELLGWVSPRLSTCYLEETKEEGRSSPEVEPEFVYFPDIKGYAIQWHPEWMDGNTEATRYALKVINGRI